MKKKLIRITTVPYSLGSLLKGQLKYMSSDYEVIGIASSEPEGDLERAAASQNARGIPIKMTRKITPFQDLRSLFILYRVLRKEKPFFRAYAYSQGRTDRDDSRFSGKSSPSLARYSRIATA